MNLKYGSDYKKTQLKNPQELKTEVLNWLETMRLKDEPYGTYKIAKMKIQDYS
jgi:hypothetical protein